MIFVTLGTQDKTFERLLIKINELIIRGVIVDEVIVQAGNTHYVSNNMKIISFVSMPEFIDYLNKCSFLITHGGVGSIVGGLNAQKKVLAVARRVEYGEHENNHQIEIIEKFTEEGYILGCTDIAQLEDQLARIMTFTPKKYISNQNNFCILIDKLINGEQI